MTASVRSMPSYRGQRSDTGLWWLATTGRHVGYESWLERPVDAAGLRPRSRGGASQPFWLSWQHDGQPRSHAPDFFARLADGGGVVVDVRPAGRIRARDAWRSTRLGGRASWSGGSTGWFTSRTRCG